MKKADISSILRSDKTVFSFKDILLTSGESNPALLRRRLHYYVKSSELHAIRRGFYAKDKNYDRMELATKILAPAYISFETVLRSAGVIFQHYEQIFVASYVTRDIAADGQTYHYQAIKNPVLTDTTGIEQKENYAIASKERAFLDVVYRSKDYYFDNLAPLDWNKVFEILPIYNNKQMAKKVHKYHENFKAESIPEK
jgi:predicted transcriptional regulator of viral defense system